MGALATVFKSYPFIIYETEPSLMFVLFLSCRIPKQRDLSGRVYASDEARSYAIKRAEEVEAKLGSAYPSFIKPMLQSHTTGGFWLVSMRIIYNYNKSALL